MSEEQKPQESQQRIALLTALSAVSELFESDGSDIEDVVITIYPEDGDGNEMEPVQKAVVFRPCKTKHLGAITGLVFNMLNGFNDETVVGILEFVSKQQQRALEEGVSPYQLDTKELVQKAVISGATVTQLFQGVVNQLPNYISMFTNLTREEIDNADPAHGAIVAYGIFARNYHFFTQNGPLLGRAFMESLVHRVQKNETKKATQ